MAFKLEETVGIALFNCAYSFRTAQRSLEAHLFDYIVSVFTEGSEGIGEGVGATPVTYAILS